jgi:L-alanine-DL-glutamate epimerase-like enolase superfamily enzyme
MAIIKQVTAFLVDLPVQTVRVDAMQSFVKQETIFVEIVTDDGLTGLGYSYTIGTGGRAVLSMLNDHLLPRLMGCDSREIEKLWQELLGSTRATAVGAITSLSLAAIDLALWDLRCLRADEPLWRMAGGFRDRVPLYDTEGGWLHLPVEELASSARASRDAGWGGVKIKVGKASLNEDIERIAAVREALGPDLDLMLDANQAFTRSESVRRAAGFEPFQIRWFEEPMPADDISGHEFLARSTSIPVAVGESIYAIEQFAEYLGRQAAGVIQVDVARIGGITPWLKVAHLAEAFNVEICPHFLMEIHVSLAAAISNGVYVEHIPQLDLITRGRVSVVEGFAVAPSAPGLGIEWDPQKLDEHRVA